MKLAPARGGGRQRQEASPVTLEALEQQVAELESALEDVEWASTLVDFDQQAPEAFVSTGKVAVAASKAARQPLKTHAGAARVLAREISDELQAWREEQEELFLRGDREFAASRAEALQLALNGAIWPRAPDEAAPGSRDDPVRQAVMKDLFSQANDILRRRLQEASDRPGGEADRALAGPEPAGLATLSSQLQEACWELRTTTARAPPEMLRAIESLGGAVERKADRMRGMRARFRQDKAPVDPEATGRVKASASRRQEALSQEASRRHELLQLVHRSKQDGEELSEQLGALARAGPADRGQLQWSLLWPNQTETFMLSARGAASPSEDAASAPPAGRLEALSPPAEPGARRFGAALTALASPGNVVAILASPSPGSDAGSPRSPPRSPSAGTATWRRGINAVAGAEADLEEVSRELEIKAEDFRKKLCEDFRGMCEDSDQRRKGAEAELDAWKLDANLDTLEDLRSTLADSSEILAARLRASIHPAAQQPPKERLLRAKAAAESFQNFKDENLAEEIAAARALLAELRAAAGERRNLAAGQAETACEKRWGDLQEQLQVQAERAEAGSARCVGAAALELLSKCGRALPLPQPAASARDIAPAQRASRDSAGGHEELPHELIATAERALGEMPPSAESCAVLQGLLCLAEDALRAVCDRLARMEEGEPEPPEVEEPARPAPPTPFKRSVNTVASGRVASAWKGSTAGQAAGGLGHHA